ncbi:MAG TPA: hypothetical protein VL984_00635 [Acidimicrobiales bacterium]|nr:hypothetical protein [Acidimicrobiales bacterium]
MTQPVVVEVDVEPLTPRNASALGSDLHKTSPGTFASRLEGNHYILQPRVGIAVPDNVYEPHQPALPARHDPAQAVAIDKRSPIPLVVGVLTGTERLGVERV